MAEGLAALGWDVWVATSMAGNSDFSGPERDTINGVQLVHFKFTENPAGSAERWAGFDTCRDFIMHGGFDIVVTQCWDSHISLCAQQIARNHGGKWVLVSHGFSAHMYVWQRRITMGIGLWMRGLWFTISRLPGMIRSYDQLIFLSDRKDFGRFFDHTMAGWLKHPDIQVVANGIDLDRLGRDAGKFREKHGIGDSPMALCVANYSKRKNQRLAIQAFRETNLPGSVLVCIGSELNEYGRTVVALDQELAATHRNCRVLILEKLDREETFSAFDACDLFLLTAKAETQPIVLIEAMAASKPWISTDTGCVAEMRGGRICRLETGDRYRHSRTARRLRDVRQTRCGGPPGRGAKV